ncbi:hypothetical protein HJG60_011377 [Phyllostomus discolor]|uniref:Uncharacterized protein n=1 Tax=Phyllostomus discolor TaxID=89673 RepID=A0A834A4K7_9CHIR|nr:hypothetical protein HJG60_011377 [Phyllostomus discolor]
MRTPRLREEHRKEEATVGLKLGSLPSESRYHATVPTTTLSISEHSEVPGAVIGRIHITTPSAASMGSHRNTRLSPITGSVMDTGTYCPEAPEEAEAKSGGTSQVITRARVWELSGTEEGLQREGRAAERTG